MVPDFKIILLYLKGAKYSIGHKLSFYTEGSSQSGSIIKKIDIETYNDKKNIFSRIKISRLV